MRIAWRRTLLLLITASFGCAHADRQDDSPSLPATDESRVTHPVPSEAPPAPPPKSWEPHSPDAFEECRIEGETPERQCREQWGHFFLRVLNQHRMSIPAYLSFSPAVNRVHATEDGFSGLVRPGRYKLTIESPGYARTTLTFEVGVDEKALLEVELENEAALEEAE